MATTIFGHWGCPAHEPENSPAGFRYALTHGAEGIETDLHLTKDGVPGFSPTTLKGPNK